MVRIGDVTLPDGRVVHGRIVTTYERDTNATNIIKLELEWKDGDRLSADECNKQINGELVGDWVVDRLLMLPPEPEEFDWL